MKNAKLLTLSITICLMLALVIIPVTACTQEPSPQSPSAPSPAAPAPSTPAAPQVIELNYADSSTPTMPGSLAADWFANEVGKRSGGKVKVNVYHSGSLGKGPELAELVLKGSVDIAAIMGGFTPGRFPVQELPTQMPFMGGNIPAYEHIMNDLRLNGHCDTELDGYHLLWYEGNNSWQLFTTDKKVRTMQDMQGMRIRTAGIPPTLCQALGIEPVGMPMGEIYSALDKGTVEGAICGIEIVTGFKLTDMIKYAFWGDIVFGTTSRLMNKAKWESLPAEAKVVLTDVSKDVHLVSFRYYKQAEAEWVDAIEKAGVEITRPDAAELAKLQAATSGVFDDYIAELSSLGMNGEEIKASVLFVMSQY